MMLADRLKCFSGDLRTLLKQIRDNSPVEQSHKIALFWINIGMSYDEVRCEKTLV